MKHAAASTLLALAPLLAFVRAQQTCNVTSPCGTDATCCSEFGFCSSARARARLGAETDRGVADAFCGAGCNPLFSNTVDSCAPVPICADKTVRVSP